MACSCANQSIRCLQFGTADLCCPKIAGRCKSETQLASIGAETKTRFDGGDRTGIDPAELDLLGRYATAIEVAKETVAGRVCMARYAGGCSVCVRICVPPRPCVCECPCGPPGCGKATVTLDDLSLHVDPSRFTAASVDGEPASLDGDHPDASYQVTTHGTVRLSGPVVTSGGTVEICFDVAASPLLRQAVLSYACASVPCHDRECSRNEHDPTQHDIATSGLTGDEFADRLNVECVRAGRGGGFVRPSVIEWVRWDAAP